jgi:hypothetical protein
MALRRARGALLRIVRRRPLAMAIGGILLVPGAWMELNGGSRTWWVDGLTLIVAATGAALVWTGLTGVSPDWID